LDSTISKSSVATDEEVDELIASVVGVEEVMLTSLGSLHITLQLRPKKSKSPGKEEFR